MLSDNRPIRWMYVALQGKYHDTQSLRRSRSMLTCLLCEQGSVFTLFYDQWLYRLMLQSISKQRVSVGVSINNEYYHN